MLKLWGMKSKVRVNIEAGGIFSKMMSAIQNIQQRGYDIEQCYLNIADTRALNEAGFNPLDYVLDQALEDDYEHFYCVYIPSYNSKNANGYGRVEESEEYLKLKEIASKIKYRKDFLDIVASYSEQITKDTIGVHIRLCDMNLLHTAEYGSLTFEDFIKAIEKEISPTSKLFVASDNTESLKKLQTLFKDRILYVDDMIRAATEDSNSSSIQLDCFQEERFWKEAFLEMLLLSKCSKLICRTSNLANMAIISSNTIEKIIML
jgi:hypothetical protein